MAIYEPVAMLRAVGDRQSAGGHHRPGREAFRKSFAPHGGQPVRGLFASRRKRWKISDSSMNKRIGRIASWIADREWLRRIVSKQRNSVYRPGRSRVWLKVKNPTSPAMTRVWEDRL